MYLTMAPDGKTVWVVSITGARETTADNTLTPVAVASNRPGPSFHMSGWLNYQDTPSAAAITPDSGTLYVAARSGLETFHVSLQRAALPGAALPGAKRYRAQRLLLLSARGLRYVSRVLVNDEPGSRWSVPPKFGIPSRTAGQPNRVAIISVALSD
jgi:hypothetical protein